MGKITANQTLTVNATLDPQNFSESLINLFISYIKIPDNKPIP
jgi:hypothetical protein